MAFRACHLARVASLILAAGLVPPLAVTSTLADTPAAASHEGLAAARSKLGDAMDSVRHSHFTKSPDDRKHEREMMTDGRKLHEEATTAGPSQDTAALVTKMNTLADEMTAYVQKGASASGSEPATVYPAKKARRTASEAPSAESKPEMAEAPAIAEPDELVSIVEVNRFHDVFDDVRDVWGRLSEDEQKQARNLHQHGEDITAELKRIKLSDHVRKQDALTRLSGVTTQLLDLHQTALDDRRSGIPFVTSAHATNGWTTMDVGQSGFQAIRARFIPPGSAYITVRNTTEEMLPLKISLRFTSGTGLPTGDADYATGPLEEVRPDEVREVLVPIHPIHSRFWDVTTDYAIDMH